MGDSVSRAVVVGRSVEFDGQVRSVLAEQLAVVVADGPERREAAGLHGAKEVLPPAALQVHEALQALLGVGLHHLQAVRHVRLVKNPEEEETRGGGGEAQITYKFKQKETKLFPLAISSKMSGTTE